MTRSRRSGAALVASLLVLSLVSLLLLAGPRAAQQPTTHGEWVTIRRGGDSLRAYVAYPERKDKAPAVIVIHEIFGLTPWETTVADQLAAKGYVAILPDLLSSKYGVTPASPDSGRKLVAQLEPERVTADLDATFGHVNGLPAVKKGQVATIGFCWGGGQSFAYAVAQPELNAAVVYYGTNPQAGDVEKVKAAVMGNYGGNDQRVNATVPAAQDAAKKAGKTYEVHTYEGAGHGFLRQQDGQSGANLTAARQAWPMTIAFFRTNLGR